MISPIFEGAKLGLTPPFRGDPLRWISENVRIAHSARSTRFDPATAPWLNDPFRAVTNDRIKSICLRAPTGGGKTTFLEAMCVPWVVAQQPGPMLIVGQSDDMVKEFAESRLLPILNACEPVAKLFPEDRHQKRKTSIMFPHMALFMTGANLTGAQEKSMRYVYGDEVWRWRPGLLGEFQKRFHDRWNRKGIWVSQGSFHGDDFDLECRKGEQNEWGTDCESCGHWHKYLWNSIKWDEVKTAEDEYDWQAVSESVRHECPHCGHVTPNTTAARRAMASRGRYMVEPSNFVAGHITFTWSALAVWWISWADLVVEWLKAMREKSGGNIDAFRQFMQKRLAQTWKPISEEPSLHLVSADYVRADHADGQPVDGEAFRFMTIDRQRDHYWSACRAWRADGTSRLVWEGKVLTVETLRELQQRLKVRDKLVFMDAQFETGQTYSECAAYGWTALHGSGQDGFAHVGPKVTTKRFYSPVKEATAPNGKRCRYIFWSNEGVKDELVRLRAAGSPHWEFPADVSADYLDHLNSEVKKDLVDKVTKAVKQRYVKFKKDNHLWDCEAMQIAAAMMLGVIKGASADG